MLHPDVAGCTREPRAVLLLLAVTVDAGLDAGVRRRAVMESRGPRVALDTVNVLRAVALLARMAGGAPADADGLVRQGVVVDVFVGEPGEAAARRVAGDTVSTAVEYGLVVAPVADRGNLRYVRVW